MTVRSKTKPSFIEFARGEVKRSGSRRSPFLESAMAVGAFTAVIAIAPQARAVDGCIMFDRFGQTGSSITALLSDDLTIPGWAAAPYSKTGFSHQTAVGLEAAPLDSKAESVFINAGLSQVNLYFWHPGNVDVPDTSLDYGGDGSFYRGAVFGMGCPKGQACAMDIPNTLMNTNRAWQCMREFYTDSQEDLKIPLQRTQSITSPQNPWDPNSLSIQRFAVVNRWADEVTSRVKREDGVKTASMTKAYVTAEPFYAYCKNTNANCPDMPKNQYADTVRFHWEGVIDPKAPSVSTSWCTVETLAECNPVFGLGVLCALNLFDEPPICASIIQPLRVAVDTWVRIHINNGVLNFFRGATKVAVQSGPGSSGVQAKFLQSMTNTAVEDIFEAGILDGVGEAFCGKVLADPSTFPDFVSRCTLARTSEWARALEGATFLAINQVGLGAISRFQNAYFMRTDQPQFIDFPSTGPANSTKRPHIMYMNFTRDQTF
jgi:hypothetical protein